MKDLNHLREQRDELTRQIEAEEKQQTRDFHDTLDQLRDAVEEWGESRGFPSLQRWVRKNWHYVTFGDIRTGFGYPAEGYSPPVAVTVQDLTSTVCKVEFTGLPSVSALIGLIDGMLTDLKSRA